MFLGSSGISGVSPHLTTIESSTLKLGLPAYSSALILKFWKFVSPKATRLVRFNRLFMPSVGPFDTCFVPGEYLVEPVLKRPCERSHLEGCGSSRTEVDDVAWEFFCLGPILGLVEPTDGLLHAVGEGRLGRP